MENDAGEDKGMNVLLCSAMWPRGKVVTITLTSHMGAGSLGSCSTYEPTPC